MRQEGGQGDESPTAREKSKRVNITSIVSLLLGFSYRQDLFPQKCKKTPVGDRMEGLDPV